ncbi:MULTISPECIES: pyridoxamine 5'-phosphate oxidase family protein [Leuconostoc]|uniref:Permease of the major facilitator superfamily n=1 Tax=Leuconostoc citreum (strain KM20) TaxID=349519 RepID=B1N028_LEUCK|nr:MULTISPECIES: pyridoxamine 5'-phosphate oxidase family protein [Leuconostoc]ACA83130.1 Permease of the major facilitator superfamily [Leuconostoc citreum KM20]MBA5938917.1 pyridoxamine 5'-phosphate oxidase family protein [Leuconostoc citreum]MCQ6659345.1 pyridoxamine 5'-phosphate oxidase family protein [Leuconostoc citreum]MCS8583750.1 pyridoxamine 5'-phosphate oxidase family protein [Leuconostoc citreum]MCS8587075.1 pyridoxamine 5'-phosphate oxidase family protein [Leuconostoc citreum]
MYTKRFVQLFVIFLVTMFIATFILQQLNIQGYVYQALTLTIVGYIILTIPLTILTILKQRKKFNNSTSNQSKDMLQKTLETLENVMVLSTVSESKALTTSVITFKQSRSESNVFYLVTAGDTQRVAQIRATGRAAFTTWYQAKTGQRISSNQVTATIIDDRELQHTLDKHPEIKELSDDFSHQVIIKLRVHTLIIESFRDQPRVMTFEN